MNFVRTADRRTSVRLTGAVYTAPSVAQSLVEFIASILPNRAPRILEPSVGDGAFVKALARSLPKASLNAIDIDRHVIDGLRACETLGLVTSAFHLGDFIEFAIEKINENAVFDLIIGNPPFIRKHNFSQSFEHALNKLAVTIDYPRTNLKNSWVAFLLASAELVHDRGAVAFILPYEMMTVTYGQAALLHLLGIFHRIDLFISDEKAFPKINQDAIIFVGRKRSEDPEGLFVQRVKSMTSLTKRNEFQVSVGSNANLGLELSSFLISSADLAAARRLRSKMPTIGDYCSSAPGIVTAANEYFILTESKAVELGLMAHTLPILKKSTLPTWSPVFRTENFTDISEREPCRFVRISGPGEILPLELKRYVKIGEKLGYHHRYKCRHREHWYQVPLVEKVTSFIFRRSHDFPRLCLNQAEVYITDNAYGLKPKGKFTDRGICFSFYNSLTLLFAETDGRFYGGGVLELSPAEFRRLPLVYHEPSDTEFEEFVTVHKSAGRDIDSILDFGDRWLRDKAGLSLAELRGLRSAWRSVRAHRLRHGRQSQNEEPQNIF